MEECGNPACRKVCEDPKACARCKATPYCSRACQKADYKAHKKICGTLNANKAAQLQHPDHLDNDSKGAFVQQCIAGLASYSRESQQLYRLFMSTTKEQDPRDTAKIAAKMNAIASRIDLIERHRLLFQIIPIIISEKKWRLTQPTSLLLVLLNSGVDPSALSLPNNQSSPDEHSYTALHNLAEFTSPDNPRINENQVIIGRQLIEAGANVNGRAGSDLLNITPLHTACYSANVNNLEFIELLLDHGANPNLQSSRGETPLMYTLEMAMPAAKLLLTYDYGKSNSGPINVNVQTQTGSTMLGGVRRSLDRVEHQREAASVGAYISDKGWTLPEQFDYLLSQLREVQALLVSKGAIDNGWQSIRSERNRDPDYAQSVQTPAPLPYDVGALFDKDLSDSNAVPSWYSRDGFFINDDIARQFEVNQKKDHLHSSDGKRPALGQKLQIKFKLPNDTWGRLAGEINEVGPVPNDAQLKRSDSFMYGKRCACRDPKCNLTRTGKRAEILRKYGAVHGQEVEGVVSLASEYRDDASCSQFFRGADARYAVVLRCNDNKENMWEMVRINPLDSSIHQQSQDGESKMCARGCGKPGSKTCSACKQVAYCTQECQREHWRVHKRDCRKKPEKAAKGGAP